MMMKKFIKLWLISSWFKKTYTLFLTNTNKYFWINSEYHRDISFLSYTWSSAESQPSALHKSSCLVGCTGYSTAFNCLMPVFPSLQVLSCTRVDADRRWLIATSCYQMHVARKDVYHILQHHLSTRFESFFSGISSFPTTMASNEQFEDKKGTTPPPPWLGWTGFEQSRISTFPGDDTWSATEGFEGCTGVVRRTVTHPPAPSTILDRFASPIQSIISSCLLVPNIIISLQSHVSMLWFLLAPHGRCGRDDKDDGELAEWFFCCGVPQQLSP